MFRQFRRQSLLRCTGVVSIESRIYGIGSVHNGGANILKADGSTEFVRSMTTKDELRTFKQQWRRVDLITEKENPQEKKKTGQESQVETP